MAKIKANLIAGKVSSNSGEAKTLFSSSRFGEKIGEKIFYSIQEALFLLDSQKIIIYDFNDRPLDNHKLQHYLHYYF